MYTLMGYIEPADSQGVRLTFLQRAIIINRRICAGWASKWRFSQSSLCPAGSMCILFDRSTDVGLDKGIV
jgi:hypothetical protein